MSIKCDHKKTQYILAVTIGAFGSIHYYMIDKQCFKDGVLFSFVPILVVVFVWDTWLYNGLTENKSIPWFSFQIFQCLLTLVLIFLAILMFFIVAIGYKPEGYISGIC